MRKKFNWGSLITHIFFILVCLAYLLPFIMVISISISSESSISTHGFRLFPAEIDFGAYKEVFANPTQLINSYRVTIIFSFLTMVLSVIIMTMAAYPMSRSNYRFKNALTFYIFFTILFKGGLVPSYIINTKYLGLGNNIWIYVLPALVNAWYVIIIRTFFKGLPNGLVESAKIDGASELKIYFRIIMPLSQPVVATIAFMTIIAKWNDWDTALIYIRTPSLYSLQFMLQRVLREAEFVKSMSEKTGLLSNYQIPTESMRYAIALLAAGPMVMIFPFFQKYFVKGMTIGAIKG